MSAKRILSVIAVLLTVSLMTSCGGKSGQDKMRPHIYYNFADVRAEDIAEPVVIEKQPHYVIYEGISSVTSEVCHRYEITDNDGNVVMEGCSSWITPDIDEADGIVSVHYTDGIKDLYRYYDVVNDRISGEYDNILARCRATVCVYERNDKQLVIMDAFSGEVKNTVKRNFADMQTPIKNVRFTDGSILLFTYMPADCPDIELDEMIAVENNDKKQEVPITDVTKALLFILFSY